MLLKRLYEFIAAIAPIEGIAIGDPAKRETWRIDFAQNATAQQRTAAANALAAFDPNAPEDLDALDNATLNAILTEPGSVVRAMAEIQFGMIKGTIPVTPSLTKQQYLGMLKQRMRSP